MKNECYYDNYDRKEEMAFDTKVVHGGMGCDPITGAVSFPIFQTATFRHRAFGISTGYDYTRVQNPTRQELERTMAILENGLEGFAFSSGQAANMALFTWLPQNSHVILSDDIYGGTFRICDEIFSKFGCTFSWIDLSDLEAVRAAIRPETKMIYIETPTNPMMKVADIAALADQVEAVRAGDLERPLVLPEDADLRRTAERLNDIQEPTWWSTAAPSTSAATTTWWPASP